ncbi:unnamed protein product, partial [Amoebophrya sp. A25]
STSSSKELHQLDIRNPFSLLISQTAPTMPWIFPVASDELQTRIQLQTASSGGSSSREEDDARSSREEHLLEDGVRMELQPDLQESGGTNFNPTAELNRGHYDPPGALAAFQHSTPPATSGTRASSPQQDEQRVCPRPSEISTGAIGGTSYSALGGTSMLMNTGA